MVHRWMLVLPCALLFAKGALCPGTVFDEADAGEVARLRALADTMITLTDANLPACERLLPLYRHPAFRETREALCAALGAQRARAARQAPSTAIAEMTEAISLLGCVDGVWALHGVAGGYAAASALMENFRREKHSYGGLFQDISDLRPEGRMKLWSQVTAFSKAWAQERARVAALSGGASGFEGDDDDSDVEAPGGACMGAAARAVTRDAGVAQGSFASDGFEGMRDLDGQRARREGFTYCFRSHVPSIDEVAKAPGFKEMTVEQAAEMLTPHHENYALGNQTAGSSWQEPHLSQVTQETLDAALLVVNTSAALIQRNWRIYRPVRQAKLGQ